MDSHLSLGTGEKLTNHWLGRLPTLYAAFFSPANILLLAPDCLQKPSQLTGAVSGETAIRARPPQYSWVSCLVAEWGSLYNRGFLGNVESEASSR
jgi:hypothetical protein